MARLSSHLLSYHHYTDQQALSSRCFYHAPLLSVSPRKLESPREQNSLKHVYIFFQDSYCWVINRRIWRSWKIEGELTTIWENCSPSWSVCVWCVNFQTCDAVCCSSVILQKQYFFVVPSWLYVWGQRTHRVWAQGISHIISNFSFRKRMCKILVNSNKHGNTR